MKKLSKPVLVLLSFGTVLLVAVLFSPSAYAALGDDCTADNGQAGLMSRLDNCISLQEISESVDFCWGSLPESATRYYGIEISTYCFLALPAGIMWNNIADPTLDHVAGYEETTEFCPDSVYALKDPVEYVHCLLDEHDILMAYYSMNRTLPLGIIPLDPERENTFRCTWLNGECVLDEASISCNSDFYTSEEQCEGIDNQEDCPLASFDCVPPVLPPPDTPGPEPQEPDIQIGLAQKVANLYTWVVSLAGLVALGVIIFGGVLYAASAGNPSRITEAKSWITHALMGLFMLLGTYLILGFINPDLTKLDEVFLAQNVNPQSQGLELGPGACPAGGPAECKERGCTQEEFVEYAKSFVTATEEHGLEEPTSGPHCKYIRTDPKGPGFKDENVAGRCWGADCGVYVGTVITNTIDGAFPPSGTEGQWRYLMENSTIERIEPATKKYIRSLGPIQTEGHLEDGDILMPLQRCLVLCGIGLQQYCPPNPCDYPHGHIALWIEGSSYEAGYIRYADDPCAESYLPRGPRLPNTGNRAVGMDYFFRYNHFLEESS